MNDIWISTLDRKEVLQFPWLPPQLPNYEQIGSDEEFETFNNGTYLLQGAVNNFGFELTGKLPQKAYAFNKSSFENTDKIISLLTRARRKNFAIRFVSSVNNKEVMNLVMSVGGFAYSYDKVGNVIYTATLKQWKVFE
ncbi:hypothetical protein [Clostridium tagluense]|uniref:hypothetical protein n=1 Tax=Clostridium tagluense TaxID=360422 RepID=UPI001C6EE58B|nr:hypothetical protein [Clostridium tagluense]MBW9154857.1 hypothetical protein [Clostridium tagluense]WLC64312.1 hypothetical protein KTC93_15735 [Clostridium tagluense]